MRPGADAREEAKVSQSREHSVDEVKRELPLNEKRIGTINVVRGADNFYKSIPE